MPATRTRQSTPRRVHLRRPPQRGRYDALRRPAARPAARRGRRSQQSSGLRATITSALSNAGGRAQRPGKGGLLALLTAAGAGGVAFARRRAKQRDAIPHEPPPPA